MDTNPIHRFFHHIWPFHFCDFHTQAPDRFQKRGSEWSRPWEAGPRRDGERIAIPTQNGGVWAIWNRKFPTRPLAKEILEAAWSMESARHAGFPERRAPC